MYKRVLGYMIGLIAGALIIYGCVQWSDKQATARQKYLDDALAMEKYGQDEEDKDDYVVGDSYKEFIDEEEQIVPFQDTYDSFQLNQREWAYVGRLYTQGTIMPGISATKVVQCVQDYLSPELKLYLLRKAELIDHPELLAESENKDNKSNEQRVMILDEIGNVVGVLDYSEYVLKYGEPDESLIMGHGASANLMEDEGYSFVGTPMSLLIDYEFDGDKHTYMYMTNETDGLVYEIYEN